MPVFVIDLLKPQGTGQFPTHEDVDALGGFQVQASPTTRNAIPTANRKIGMLVYTVSDGYFYQLIGGTGNGNWTLTNFAGSAAIPMGGDIAGTNSAATVFNLSGALVSGLQETTVSSKLLMNQGMRRHVTNTMGPTYTVLATDDIVATDSTGGVITINLPATPSAGDTYTVKDGTGQAATHNVTIAGNGHNIDGLSTFVVSVNFASIVLVFNGTVNQWNIV